MKENMEINDFKLKIIKPHGYMLQPFIGLVPTKLINELKKNGRINIGMKATLKEYKYRMVTFFKEKPLDYSETQYTLPLMTFSIKDEFINPKPNEYLAYAQFLKLTLKHNPWLDSNGDCTVRKKETIKTI